jgi:serine/threonine protein kinase/tetratricopeptide (TPR) repeat protein
MREHTSSDHGERVNKLAGQARELVGQQREKFLDEHCAGNDGLRAEIQGLLATQDEQVRGSLAQTMDPSTAPSDRPTSVTVSSRPKPANSQIGPYKLLEVIGEGGFGVVWLADQLAPVRRRVALKIIKPGMDSKAVIARFEQERQALAMMDHANIAKVFDAGTSPDGRPYFVMEHVAGEAITTYCDRNRLNVQQRLELFIPICEAVQHAHHKGIIHRDIKPTNVLVSVAPGGGPGVKVIDFGVAKAVSHVLTDKTLFTEQGQILGTPEYMSPEQAEMGALDIDTRTDVYSLGVMLYEILTGALPFEPKDLRSKGYNEIQRIIREVDPPRPSHRLRSLGARSADIAQRRQSKLQELEGQLRRELEWIPLKAMRKDRDQRYITPQAMADDIRNHLAGRPLVAGPETVMYRTKKFVYRNRWGVSAAAAVLAALIAGGIVSTIGFVRAASNARLAQEQSVRAEAEATRAKAEALRLWQTNVYNTSLLANANPLKGEARDVTVRELLDGAVRQLDNGAQAGQPRVEAALRETLAMTYSSLSRWDDAEQQARKALALETSAANGADTPGAAIALTALAQAQLAQSQLNDAEKSLKRALLVQREQSSADDPFLGDTLSYLGILADARGELERSEALYREALAIYQKHPENIDRVADGMTNLATAMHKLGDNKQAIELASEALLMRRKLLGEKHIDVWHSLTNLASIEEAQSDLTDAEKMRRQALALAKELLQEKNLKTVQSINGLARTLWLRGGETALAEAETLQTRGVELAREVEGPKSLTAAVGVDRLACIALDRGNTDEAVEQFREVLALRREVQSDQHPDTAAAMSLLADAIVKQGGEPDEAIQLAQSALAIRKQVYPPGNWAIWNTTSVLGGAYAAAGKFDQAEPLLLESFDGLKAGSVLGKRTQRDAAGRLVALYEKWGRQEQAGQWRQKLYQLAQATSVR